MTSHDLVTALLVYLLVGSIIWMLLYSAGLVTTAWRRRIAEDGANARLGLVLASVAVIVAWPVPAWSFVAGVWAGLRRR